MIFLDSSFIVAYYNEDDSLHEKALSIAKEIAENKYGTSVITDYVFSETVTVIMLKAKMLEPAAEAGERILNSTFMINTDHQLVLDSFETFKKQGKPKLSFIDCSIIAVCNANGIANIATFDKALKEASGLNVID